MSRLWSAVVEGLTPYVPGEQPHVADLVKLNTNESPFGPSPRALEAIRAAATDDLRLYPDFDATELRETLAAYHGVKPEQVFPGNGSDEVLGHTFAALLKPWALIAYVLGVWRLASDMGLTREFVFTGIFSHWQVWMGIGVFVHIVSSVLARYGSGGELRWPRVFSVGLRPHKAKEEPVAERRMAAGR